MTSFPEAVRARAAARPEEPWLFVRRGWDWRWLAWGAAARRLEAAARRLVASWPAPAERRAALAYRADPPCLLLDLAAQAAGLTAVPVDARRTSRERARAAAERGAAAWLEPLGPAERIPGVVPPPGLPVLAVDLGGDEADAPARGIAPGAVVVAPPEGPAEVLSQEELAAAAGRLAGAVGAGRERDIAVLFRPLELPDERVFVAWAIGEGAALVLEPDAESAVATAVWARPTVFAGEAPDLARLAVALAGFRPPLFARRRFRRAGLPLGRLRAVLVAGGEPLAPAVEAGFRRRGVAVVPLGALAAPRRD